MTTISTLNATLQYTVTFQLFDQHKDIEPVQKVSMVMPVFENFEDKNFKPFMERYTVYNQYLENGSRVNLWFPISQLTMKAESSTLSFKSTNLEINCQVTALEPMRVGVPSENEGRIIVITSWHQPNQANPSFRIMNFSTVVPEGLAYFHYGKLCKSGELFPDPITQIQVKVIGVYYISVANTKSSFALDYFIVCSKNGITKCYRHRFYDNDDILYMRQLYEYSQYYKCKLNGHLDPEGYVVGEVMLLQNIAFGVMLSPLAN
jgi:hypothetical protein